MWGSTPPTRMNRREQGKARGYIEHHTGKREAFCKPIMACASRDDARRSCPHWPASRRALGPAAEQRGQGTGRSGTGRRGLGDLATKNGGVSPFVSLEAFFLGSLCSCPSGGFVGWVGALGLGLSGVSGRPCVGTGALVRIGTTAGASRTPASAHGILQTCHEWHGGIEAYLFLLSSVRSRRAAPLALALSFVSAACEKTTATSWPMRRCLKRQSQGRK